ncbi:hypothetical protein KIN20_026541 [Parelaphostrongylus tenuis]|uniref:Uncharacterized protein n=1 Tax=Parelaphostrongylus tenuis TaxID=148309 RepID=A0AAD5QYD7_PARTN|nr:hypothetical protein KIN20_026541 [Parelaphostrongylus tenuis]
MCSFWISNYRWHLRKTVVSARYSCPHSELYREEVEVKIESENSTASFVTPQYESDAEPSGSVTPLRTDGEDNDKLSTSDNQSGGGRMMSPVVREEANENGQRTIDIVQWLLIANTFVRKLLEKMNEKTTIPMRGRGRRGNTGYFHFNENKVYRIMEQEQSLDKFELLGLPPIDDSLLTTDDAIEILERRLGELREIYHQSKLELLHIEKRKRKLAEKKKERERASRELVAVEVKQCDP